VKDFTLRRELQGILHTQGHLGKYFPEFSCPGTQRLLPLWPKMASLLFKLGSRPWHCPCDSGFAGMHNARVMESWGLLPRFQRKAQEARECVTESESLQASPDSVKHEFVRLNPKLQ
jgi:hypothetical protein